MPLRIPRLPLTLVPACIVACFNPSQTSEDGNASADDTSSHDTGDSTGSSPTSSSNPSTTMTTADTDTDGVTTQTTTDPTSDDECGPLAKCTPAAPEGWAGPFLRDPDGTCSGSFPNLHLTLGTDVDAPPASCACTCGNPTGLSCTSEVRVHGSAAVIGHCFGTFVTASLTNGVCGTDGIGSELVADPPIVSGGNCSSTVTPDIVPATLSDRFSLCGSTPSSACDGGAGACLPVEPEARLCIVVPGEADCPVDGHYGARELLFADIDDSRGCSDCTCTATGSCTNWTVRMHSTNFCGGSSYSFPPDGGCRVPTGGPYSTIRLEGGSIINQACQPGPSEATGSAMATSLHTVCCTD